MQQIALIDLEPQIADKIKASANSIWGHHNHQPEDVSVRNVIMKRWKGKGWGVARPTILGSLTGLGVGVGLGALVGHPGAMFGLGFLGCYLSTLGTLFGSTLMRRNSVQTNMSAEELRAVMRIASLSRTEASYIEVVCSLLEAGENIPEESAREILQSLSILIERYRHIDAQLERLKKVVGNESVEALEAEHSRLMNRTAQVDDPQAKEDMRQSLALLSPAVV